MQTSKEQKRVYEYTQNELFAYSPYEVALLNWL